ncbi:BTAD domain-containing putative transcriptional regulator [Lapillicoccus sp.]|uniref:AfsR/SARP family transcriptional regulator n=1 Tax=Lapillicoccus sp. TaxID=1909287 RepID=UPI0025DB6FA1|nr:BTAD domain-containing putative transcriptional regulator [Lapillicoccus sp.]
MELWTERATDSRTGPDSGSGGGGSPRLIVTTCGGLTVSGDLGALGPRQLGGAKPRRLLIALLLTPGRPISKDRLVRLLWEGQPPVGVVGTLETSVRVLRKRLDGLSCRSGSAIRTVPGGYALDPAVVELDTTRFSDLLRRARRPETGPELALRFHAAALQWVEGPFLPGEESRGWLEEARRAHAERVGRALAEAAAFAGHVQRHDLAEQWARALLDLERFDEAGWQILLESIERQGRPIDGIRAYAACRRLFADELGCAPGAVIQHTFTRLLEGTSSGGDGGLAALVDAVVRLHDHERPARSTTHGTGRTGEVGTPPPDIGGDTVEQARRLLQQLLERARGTVLPALSA